MSRELFKSMTYKDNKVYTRQCSNNVYPKHFYNEENKGLTLQWNQSKNQAEFEKWFLTFGVLQGNVEILNGSNKILRRLNYIANLLWNDKKFIELKDCEDKVSNKILSSKTRKDKNIAVKESAMIREDIIKYVSSFYDTHNSKYRDVERER